MPAAWVAAAGALVGGLSSATGGHGGNTTSTQQVQLDPQMHNIIFGSGQRQLRQGVTPIYTTTPGTGQWVVDNPENGQGHYDNTPTQTLANPNSDYTTDNGLMGRISSLLDQPQAAGMGQFGNSMLTYLNNWGEQNFYDAQHAAMRMENSYLGAPTVQGSQINAPSQNNLNLSPAYQDMIYGQPGNNPYLTGAIQKGIDQSNYAYGNYLNDATKDLTQNVLPSIRSGAIVNGSMGSSRQGIAEGKALDSYIQNVSRGATQYGMNNTDAAVSAQSGQYDADRNRALSAMGTLGGQQYQTAFNNAEMAQQANLANQSAQLSTNQLNSSNQLQGAQLSSGLLNQGYGYGGNQDMYSINRLGNVSSLIQPYTGLGATASMSTPYFTNPAAGAVGGGLLGMNLYSAYNRAGGGGATTSSGAPNYNNWSQGYGDTSRYSSYTPWEPDFQG